MEKKKGGKGGKGCRHILFLVLSFIFALPVFAQDDISQSTGIIGNGRKLGAKTYDGQTTVGILGVDSSGNTVLYSLAGENIVEEAGADYVIKVDADPQRLHTFGATSDTNLTYTFGDAGVTAVQQLTIMASTADADDDSSVRIVGGGAFGTDGTRGATIVVPGEEVSGGSDITYNAGASDTHIFQIAGTTELTLADDTMTFAGANFSIVPGATTLNFRNNANGSNNLTIRDAGQVEVNRGKLVVQAETLNVATNVEAVAGAGTTVADAAALSATKSFHQITGANGTLGWKFPAATVGDVHYLLSTTAGVPKVYAVSGGTCNGGAADAACTLLSGITVHTCYATATNAWICA